MIAVKNLSYNFLETCALNNVSFTVMPGSIAALIGPNGAGKTTLLRCISTLQTLQSGEIWVNNINISENPLEAHRHIGYLADNFGLYDDLTVRQSLIFIAYSRLKKIENVDRLVNDCAAETGVIGFMDKKINTLSRGMRQRVGIAQAVIHNPKVILLDEPGSGLDPEARIPLSELLINFKNKGMTIIVSSHILAELEDYSTEMLIMKKGELIEKSVFNPDTFGAVKRSMFKVIGSNLSFELVEILQRSFPAIDYAELKFNELIFSLDEGVTKQHEILSFLVKNGLEITEFSEVKRNLQAEYLRTIKNN